MAAPRSRDGVPGIRLHRPRSLDDRDTTTHEGIPITTIARTLLDLAATVRPDRLERALAQAERLQLYDHRAITDVLERSNGHRGTEPSRERPPQSPSSPAASSRRGSSPSARAAGLAEPEANSSLAALDHRPYEVDFYFPAHHLVVETDGWETHGTKAAFKSDRRKDAALTAAGYRVMRFTYDDVVYEPDTVVDRLTPRSAPA